MEPRWRAAHVETSWSGPRRAGPSASARPADAHTSSVGTLDSSPPFPHGSPDAQTGWMTPLGPRQVKARTDSQG